MQKEIEKMQIIAQKEILSFREAIQYLDISESFLYKMTSKRSINFFKPNNGKIYFKKSDLDKWMLQNEVVSSQVLEEKLTNFLNKEDGK